MIRTEEFSWLRAGMRKFTFATTFILLTVFSNAQQKIGFGIHIDPLVSWFSTDIKNVQNDGARPGFNFGLTFNKYFSANYSFSTGISLMRAGGRLVSSDTTLIEISSSKAMVLPGNPVVYKIQYLVIPLGLKLETNQIGYLTFFSDLGLDPKFLIGGKADVPSLGISNETVKNELEMFNLSYHIGAGIEYSLGGTSALLLGLNFDNNFLDITRDTGTQPKDKVTQKIVSFKIGINF
jgi:hypothetical protein